MVNWAKFKQDEQLKRKGGSKRTKVLGITKLDDANFAGRDRAYHLSPSDQPHASNTHSRCMAAHQARPSPATARSSSPRVRHQCRPHPCPVQDLLITLPRAMLTTGDSAKTLAISGLSVVGRDYFGVFPLKGKPLNVREAAHQQIMKNEEIQNIVKIMGLRCGPSWP